MTRRISLIAAIAVVIAALALYALRPARGVPEGAPTEDEMADDIGASVMQLLARGHVPGRSGEVMLVPKPHTFMLGEWDLTTLGTAAPVPGSSHPNPWSYLVHVPIVLYGPGYIRPRAQLDEDVDIADLAPTYARLVGMDDFEADGRPLVDALAPNRARPPKVIFSVILDGGGWDTLQEHPGSWPTIDRLGRAGTTYTNATIGSAPAITGALHATFGTGAYPVHHGIPGNQMRAPDGSNVDTYLENADPRYLEMPTVSELWDERNGNRPVVATVSYEGWHLGMIGHGAQRAGGDKDVAVLWDAEENSWWINDDYYRLPSYLRRPDLATLEGYERKLDARDGVSDGTYFGDALEVLQEDVTRPATPAFARFTGDAVVDVLRKEHIGRDALTDFFWVEMKMPDYAGHRWNMIAPQEADVLREVDRQIARFKDALDANVGEGNYVLMIGADHGQQPIPDLHGGWRMNSEELQRDITERFGEIVEKVTTVDIFFDMDAVEAEGVDLDDVARYLATYTLGDNIPEGQPGSDRVPDARLDETLLAGAFSTDYLQGLSAPKIEDFGASDYSEGDFTIESRPGEE